MSENPAVILKSRNPLGAVFIKKHGEVWKLLHTRKMDSKTFYFIQSTKNPNVSVYIPASTRGSLFIGGFYNEVFNPLPTAKHVLSKEMLQKGKTVILKPKSGYGRQLVIREGTSWTVEDVQPHMGLKKNLIELQSQQQKTVYVFLENDENFELYTAT